LDVNRRVEKNCTQNKFGVRGRFPDKVDGNFRRTHAYQTISTDTTGKPATHLIVTGKRETD